MRKVVKPDRAVSERAVAAVSHSPAIDSTHPISAVRSETAAEPDDRIAVTSSRRS